MRLLALALLLGVAGFVASGCGGTASAEEDGEIVITIASGRDQTGTYPKIMADCGKKLGFKIEQVILPPTVDAQREQYTRRLAGRDETFDVLGIDVIWTAEFSEAGWILDLTDRMQPISSEYVPSALATVTYKDKIWAAPGNTNIAMLYYRTDLVKTPPRTWQEMVKIAQEVTAKHPEMAGFVWQANQYEGFTVDVLEFIHAAGATILDESGEESVLDSPEAVKAYEFMAQLFESGVTPRKVSTFQEEEARMLFQDGGAVFMRNWPYAWALSNEEGSPVRGKFNVVGLPQFEGGTSASVLGGLNFAVSAFSPTPDEAFQAIQCITSAESQKRMFMAKNDLPTREALYSDPEVLNRSPFMTALRESMRTAVNRPVTPYYNDVTVAIARNAHAVITGNKSPEEGVKATHQSIALAVRGEGEI